jgi:hypothetical protein
VALGLVDEVVADEDEDEDEDVVGDAGGRSQGDEPWWPQPVVAAPTTRVAAAPTTVTRASSMGIPFHVNLRRSADIQAVRPRRLTLTRNASANNSSADERPRTTRR